MLATIKQFDRKIVRHHMDEILGRVAFATIKYMNFEYQEIRHSDYFSRLGEFRHVRINT